MNRATHAAHTESGGGYAWMLASSHLYGTYPTPTASLVTHIHKNTTSGRQLKDENTAKCVSD